MKRDSAILGLLLGCGLSRTEAAALTIDQVIKQEGRWVLANVAGKGNRIRNIPMPLWVKNAVDRWTTVGTIQSGPVLLAITQRGGVGKSLTAQAVYLVVRGYAGEVGIDLRPHDLRRTFAKLAHRGAAPLEQIQLSLGHASILTTERYLGVKQNLADAPCDRLGITLENL